jgi:hypothetical protein
VITDAEIILNGSGSNITLDPNLGVISIASNTSPYSYIQMETYSGLASILFFPSNSGAPPPNVVISSNGIIAFGPSGIDANFLTAATVGVSVSVTSPSYISGTHAGFTGTLAAAISGGYHVYGGIIAP